MKIHFKVASEFIDKLDLQGMLTDLTTAFPEFAGEAYTITLENNTPDDRSVKVHAIVGHDGKASFCLPDEGYDDAFADDVDLREAAEQLDLALALIDAEIA